MAPETPFGINSKTSQFRYVVNNRRHLPIQAPASVYCIPYSKFFVNKKIGGNEIKNLF
jgi:hypothetical protein